MRGGGVVVAPIKDKIGEQLGKPVALSTIYRMLARNGWRVMVGASWPRIPPTPRAILPFARTGTKTPGEV